MDTRPIGVFDSGLGGLTAVRALIKAAPFESIVYLGDTAHAPYGDKTREQLKALSRQNIRFLRRQDVKAILVACNTSNANAMDEMLLACPDLPVTGVIEPAAAQAVSATKTGRIAVLATAATVRSGAYERAVMGRMPTAQVTAVSCPRLVPLIEAGRTDPEDPALAEAVAEYTAPVISAGADTVILGCTHYPLVRAAIQRSLGPNAVLIDSGEACVGTLMTALEERSAMGDPTAAGRRQFYCSAGKEVFTAVGSAFLGWDMAPETEETDPTLSD